MPGEVKLEISFFTEVFEAEKGVQHVCATVCPAAFPNFVFKLSSSTARKPSRLSENAMRSWKACVGLTRPLAVVQEEPEVEKAGGQGWGK